MISVKCSVSVVNVCVLMEELHCHRLKKVVKESVFVVYACAERHPLSQAKV